MSGWIKLHRQVLMQDDWLAEPFTRAQAWIDLMLLANHKDGKVKARGINIDVPRGSVGRSRQNLADRWQWSKGKVNRFINELETRGQVVQLTGQSLCVISLCNYDKFNPTKKPNGTTNGNANGTTNGTHYDTQNSTQVDTQDGSLTKKVRINESNKVKNVGRTRRTRKPNDPVIELPDWMPLDIWLKYLLSREQSTKKKPMTDHYLGLCLSAIDNCRDQFTVQQIMEPMIQQGWQSVKPDFLKNWHAKNTKPNNHSGFADRDYGSAEATAGFNTVGGDA